MSRIRRIPAHPAPRTYRLALAALLGCLATAAPSFAVKSGKHPVSVRATKFSLGSGVQLANPGVAIGPGGVLWFVSLSGSVGYLSPNGHITDTPVALMSPTGAPLRPIALIAGQHGVFVLSREEPPLEVGTPPLWSAIASVDPGGSVSVLAEHLDQVNSTGHGYTSLDVSPSGTISEGSSFPFPAAASTIGPEGLAWIGGPVAGRIEIARINADGSATTFKTGIAATSAQGFETNLLVPADGSIWWGGTRYIAKMSRTGKVSRYKIPGQPNSLVQGPDSKIWFTTDLNSVGTMPRLGELSASGRPTLFSFRPATTQTVWELWPGPGKTVWLTPWSEGFVYKVALR
jgi:streptogramin lyase